jgi:predicted O-methyltransferase YrrM
MFDPKYPGIDIQLSDGDIEVLRYYVKEIKPPNCYLEIGSAEGGSAWIAYDYAPKEIEVHAVDDQQRWIFKAPKDKIHFHRNTSREAQATWNQPIGVLFIDADHDSAGADFMYWNRFVAKGGVILFHDYVHTSPKVIEDCDFLFKDNPKFEILHYIPEKKTSIFQVKKL